MNALKATISHITQNATVGLVRLECELGTLNALIITSQEEKSWEVGQSVNAIFKQTQVLVCGADFIESLQNAKDSIKFAPPTKNCVKSTITQITQEDILTRLECQAGIVALIPSEDFNTLNLAVGQECMWFINPSDILLELRES